MLKLGYKASAEQFGPTELLQFSCLAEQSGFDSVFISDHFQPWKHHGGHAPFSLAWLGALGARTSRITIGTSVMTPTFRYHPAVVAQAFATLGVMFPDRVVLGVGTGESLNEVPSTGMAWPDFKERFARLREAVTLMRQLWTEERVTFEGQYYRTQDATIYDRPATPGSDLCRRGRRTDREICRSNGRRLDLHQRQGARALYRDGVAEGAGGAGRGRLPSARLCADDRGQGFVRHGYETRHGGYPPLGGSRLDAGGEDFRPQSGRDGAPRRRALGRARRQPLDRLDRSGRACRADRRITSISASTIWSFMRRVPIRSGSSGSTRSTFCLASVAASARRTKRARAHDLSRGHSACRACP